MAAGTTRSPPAGRPASRRAPRPMLLAAPLLLALLAAGPSPVAAAVKTYTFTLNGATESPPSGSPGTGSATVTIDTTQITMHVQIQFAGLVSTGSGTTAAHIHAATALPNTGNAGVATATPTFPGFPLGVTAGTYDQLFDMTQGSSYNAAFVTAHGGSIPTAFGALVAALDASEAYLNIHTTTFPTGEIRGFSQPGANVNGDPHFTGFDGTSYFFEGRQGEVFNLLSERNTQVNALMGRIGPSMAGALSNVWMIGFGIRRGASMALQFRIDTDPTRMHLMAENRPIPGSDEVDTMFRAALPNEDSFLRIEVNGAHRDDLLYSGRTIGSANGASGDAIGLGGATVYFPTADAVNAKDARDGPLAVITTDKFRLTVLKETEGAIHLDLRVELLGATEDMDGVLGQTFRWRAAGGPGGKVKAGLYAAGDDDEFRVTDGLLGAKFARNLFSPAAPVKAEPAAGAAEAAPLAGASRKLLTLKAEPEVTWAAAGAAARPAI